MADDEGIARWTADHAIDTIRDRFGWDAVGYGSVVLAGSRSVPDAFRKLAEKGYDPAYGARPLKRVIQKNLQDPLAEMILSGRIKDGETVTISASKQGLKFNGELAAAA